MPRKCDYCGKTRVRGFQITRRGLAKKKGGVGKKITGRNKRDFRPNLQYVRAVIEGEIHRVRICTGCLKRGKVTKPPQKIRPVVAVAAPAPETAEAPPDEPKPEEGAEE